MKFNIKKHGENINLTTDKQFEFNGKTFLDIFYPINSIYMTTGEETPASKFGGTWERIENTFLLASGSLYANGSTGGEKDHVLTIDEMPSHSHNIYLASGTPDPFQGMNFGNNGVGWMPGKISNSGGGQPHSHSFTATTTVNINPPYFGVLFYERIN